MGTIPTIHPFAATTVFPTTTMPTSIPTDKPSLQPTSLLERGLTKSPTKVPSILPTFSLYTQWQKTLTSYTNYLSNMNMFDGLFSIYGDIGYNTMVSQSPSFLLSL